MRGTHAAIMERGSLVRQSTDEEENANRETRESSRMKTEGCHYGKKCVINCALWLGYAAAISDKIPVLSGLLYVR